MTSAQLEAKHKPAGGHAAPWLLAARALRGGPLLDWPELWDVLRWYAHNRGYDGNRRWSGVDAKQDLEDVEKVGNAMALLDKYGTSTMCETFCAISGLDPLGKKISTNLSGKDRPKAMNAAFPRENIEAEVRRVLEAHKGRLKDCNDEFISALMDDWRAVHCPDISLPGRFQGGLLFGQLVPRFENRIIASCPITFEARYQQALTAHGHENANREAAKAAKVPAKNCAEFLRYRWAMLVANTRIATGQGRETRPLSVQERTGLDKIMTAQGHMTRAGLKAVVCEVAGDRPNNLDQMLMHPDAEKALVLDPARKALSKQPWQAVFDSLADIDKRYFLNVVRRGKPVMLRDLVNVAGVAAEDAINEFVAKAGKSKSKTKAAPDRNVLLGEQLRVNKLAGRAPYSREVMRAAAEFVFSTDKHPTEEGGPLYRSEEIRKAQLRRAVDEQTNNHLVRHRLKILSRLHRDIINGYARGDAAAVERVAIEVNRDLRNLSGKTAKEIASDLGKRLANFKGVADKLEKAFEGKNIRVSAGLIRKARIAEDLGWQCPYTGQSFDAFDLLHRKVDKDHIIPRSERGSDSLDSLVITFAEVNKMKGKRTGLRFVEEFSGQPVPGMPHLTVRTRAQYLDAVSKLECRNGHDDDRRRKKSRRELMQISEYVEKAFTPRDLTQTSQLVRLGAQMLESLFMDVPRKPVITSLPGSVTGAVRKSWKVTGCLAVANPDVLEPVNESEEDQPRIRPKTEIRGITHLHHALDACVLVLADRFLPRNGRSWELLVKRRLSPAEQTEAKGVFGKHIQISADGQIQLADLPPFLKEQIGRRLAERRVIQHVPSEMHGLRVEQNPWRVLTVQDGMATIAQSTRNEEGIRIKKQKAEKVTKLLGLEPQGHGKLKANKSVLVIAENFGVALDPEPQIIPFHKVWHRWQELRARNGGKPPRLLRNGMLIGLEGGVEKRRGLWRVCSVKNNSSGIALDLSKPDECKASWINVLLKSLLRDGLIIVKPPLCGG